MKTTVSLMINQSVLAITLITSFSCDHSIGWSVDAPPAPMGEAYSITGTVTYPDGTPVDSAVVTDQASYAFTNTDSAGHYVLNGVSYGHTGFTADRKKDSLWEGGYGYLIRAPKGNQQIDFNVFPRYATPVQSEDRYRLSLRLYPLSYPHFNPSSYGTKMRVAFWIWIEPGQMSLDSVDSWTLYKIPAGVPWSDITIPYLESCGTPRILVSQDTVRSWSKRVMDNNYGFEPHKVYVSPAFFMQCTNGVAIVNTFTTKSNAEFWTQL